MLHLFRSCILKINNTFIDNAKDLDIIMPMYNLLEYICNYFMTSGSFWNYYRDKINDDANENPDANTSVPDVAAIQTTGSAFQISNAKLYVPVVTLSINDNIKFRENIK